jgi:hypothetical protein
MVFPVDDATKQAIQFFNSKPVPGLGKTGVYYDEESDRMFLNLFLASPLQSKKPFKLNGDYIPNWIHRFKDKPITLFKFNDHFEHPLIQGASKQINEKFQETKAVGRVLSPFDKPSDNKGTWRGVGEVLVAKVKEFLKSLDTDEVPIFNSPQFAYTEENDYDIRDPDPMHVTLTDDPAWPPEISMIKGVCEGPQDACMSKLRNASASHCEAGDTCYFCFVDALRELIDNSNSSLKIQNASSTQTKMSDQVNATKDSENKDTQNQNQNNTQDNLQNQAKDALQKVKDDFNSKVTNPEKADPKGTFDKAYDKNPNQNETPTVDPKVEALEKELAALKLKDRKSEIAKRIPLAMVTDVKSGGVSEKLLGEVVDYWVNTPKTPEEIGEFLGKQMEQIELVHNSVPKTAKASNQDNFNNQFTDEDIAAKMAGPKFDAPDVDNAANNEKIANASAGQGGIGNAWFMELSDMLVSPVSAKAKEGKGSPRRLIDL